MKSVPGDVSDAGPAARSEYPATERATNTYNISLINMPFADWNQPSFALSQLAGLTRREYPDRFDVRVCYLNQDFVEYMGLSLYDEIISGFEHQGTGIGEWLFRQIAFPELDDNAEEYFARYYPTAQWKAFKDTVIRKRAGLEEFCRSIIARYELDRMDIVGFTSMFAQTVPSLALARLIKLSNPGAVTLIGGANCEIPMGAVIAKNVATVDFVFSGPALLSFPEFLDSFMHNDLDGASKIRGVLSRENSSGQVVASAVGREREIDDFFEPDYGSFIKSLEDRPALMGALSESNHPRLYFETSRGCWWGERSHCTFCGLNSQSMNYRSMSPPIALQQFNWLFGFAPWCVEYHCTDNIMPKSYPSQVFPFLDAPAGSSIFYEIKLPVSEKDLRAMVACRVNKVQPGIEALSTSTLKLMGKGTTAFQNLQFLKNCIRFGLEPVWNLLIGFPGEDPAVYEKYDSEIPFLSHLPPPSGVYMVRFDRYSPYFMDSADYGLDLRPLDYYSLTFPFEPSELAQLAYFFQDVNISPYLIEAVTWIGRLGERVGNWRKEWSEGVTPPRLHLERDRSGAGVVHDLRFGGAEQTAVDATGIALMDRLSSPARPSRLADELKLSPDAISARLELFRQKRWVFEEGDRLMCLVVAEPPTESSQVT
jgi:ribosomal peptide maturation radical SAM protein 1